MTDTGSDTRSATAPVPGGTGSGPQRTWAEVKPAKRNIPEGLWLRCPDCGQMIYRRQMEANLHVCPECEHHFRIGAGERVRQLADTGTFEPWFRGLRPNDPLGFVDLKGYGERIEREQAKTGRDEAVMAGRAFIKGRELVLACFDLDFMMGSMGSVVGETLTRAVEAATERRLPIVIVSGSGGARMQESALSLMQMAKTSAALARHDDAGQLFISVLTDPTTGGVTASLAMLGDFIVAEPKALIGFAGPRVIKQTIRQELPEGFQTSEFVRDSGFIDRVVRRADLRDELTRLMDYASA